MNRSSRRLLVVGGGGYLGSAIVREALGSGATVHGVGRSPSPPGFPRHAEWIRLDASDAPGVRGLVRNLQPDAVVHAACPQPGAGAGELASAFVGITECLLAAVAAESPACRLVLIGSAAEYGETPAGRLSRETDPLEPLTGYGRAKVAQAGLALRDATRTGAVVARVFNSFGEGQGLHLFVGALLDRLTRGVSPLEVHDADAVRDFVDIRDVARGIVLLASAPAVPAIVNVCTGDGRTVGELALRIAAAFGIPVRLVDRSPDSRSAGRSVGDPSRLISLGWRPRFRFEESIDALVRATSGSR